MPQTPTVVLIDEIDKADIEFPNDLLRELDRMEFHCYETQQTGRHVTALSFHHLEQRKGTAGRLPEALLLPPSASPTATPCSGSSTHFRISRRPCCRKRSRSSSACARSPGLKKKPLHLRAARLAQAPRSRGHSPRRCAAATKARGTALARRIAQNEQDVHLFERPCSWPATTADVNRCLLGPGALVAGGL